MPESVTILRVFVASPGDLAEERIQPEDIIRELNLSWSKYIGMYLDLVKWETVGYPGVGADAQDVINKEIGDNYDIFIGMLWTRFGTPTKRADSGTAEEFERAYLIYSENPERLRIMFYFKDSPVPPSQLDPAQLELINRFRDQISGKGVLWWTYKTREEFGSLLRIHLSHQIQEWQKSWGRENSSETREIEAVTSLDQSSRIVATTDVKPEEGFFDLVESGQKHIKTFEGALINIGNSLNTLMSNMDEWNQGLDRANRATDKQSKIEEVKRVAENAANNMETFVAKMDLESPALTGSYALIIDALARAISLLPAFEEDNQASIQQALDLLKRSKIAIRKFSNSMGSLKQVVVTWPPLTTRFALATRQVGEIMDRIIGEMEEAVNLTSETEKGFLSFLNE